MATKKRTRCCASCDKPLRKGSVRRALVVIDGEIKRGNVCARCALRAIAFVVPPPVVMSTPCASCKRRPSKYCADCHERVCKQASDAVKANAALAVAKGL